MEPEVVELEIVDGPSKSQREPPSVSFHGPPGQHVSLEIEGLKKQMAALRMHRDSVVIDRRRGSVIADRVGNVLTDRRPSAKPRPSATPKPSGVAMRHKKANPAAVGLAGFGLTTMVLQFHNIGWMHSVSPVIILGFIFGGLAQLIAGFQEFKHGNNFGYSAFSTYGAFWIALALLLLGKVFKVFPGVTEETLGYFLVAFTCYTFIMTVACSGESFALFVVFCLLFLGFILLDISHLAHAPAVNVAAGWVLLFCAIGAWYVMAHVIYASVYGRDILPIGPSPVSLVQKWRAKKTGV